MGRRKKRRKNYARTPDEIIRKKVESARALLKVQKTETRISNELTQSIAATRNKNKLSGYIPASPKNLQKTIMLAEPIWFNLDKIGRAVNKIIEKALAQKHHPYRPKNPQRKDNDPSNKL